MAIQPSHAQNPSVALVHVEFHGHSLITFLCDGEPYAAMRPICEGMGLVWNGQYERIQRNEVLKSTIRVIRTVAADGKTREVIALPLKLLNGWLFGVDVSRVKPELRETILAYQRECYDALYRHWHREPAAPGPAAMPVPTASRLLLTLEDGKVTKSESVPTGAVVVDATNEESIERFFKRHVPDDLVPFIIIQGVTRLTKIAAQARNQAR